jgi:hypothetical protein
MNENTRNNQTARNRARKETKEVFAFCIGIDLGLELHPVGDRIVCTPTVSGAFTPFDVPVIMGQPVTITWDSELSRYIVKASGMPEAARANSQKRDRLPAYGNHYVNWPWPSRC